MTASITSGLWNDVEPVMKSQLSTKTAPEMNHRYHSTISYLKETLASNKAKAPGELTMNKLRSSPKPTLNHTPQALRADLKTITGERLKMGEQFQSEIETISEIVKRVEATHDHQRIRENQVSRSSQLEDLRRRI